MANTPNYPEYASGANSVSGAMTATLRRFFRTDHLPFTVTSDAPLAVQKSRTYLRLSDAARDVVDARMFLGFHFRFADDAGRRQGQRVAHWTFTEFLRPIRDKDR